MILKEASYNAFNRRKYSRDSFYGNDYSEQRAITFKRIFYEEKGNDNNWNIILHKIGVVYDASTFNYIWISKIYSY